MVFKCFHWLKHLCAYKMANNHSVENWIEMMSAIFVHTHGWYECSSTKEHKLYKPNITNWIDDLQGSESFRTCLTEGSCLNVRGKLANPSECSRCVSVLTVMLNASLMWHFTIHRRSTWKFHSNDCWICRSYFEKRKDVWLSWNLLTTRLFIRQEIPSIQTGNELSMCLSSSSLKTLGRINRKQQRKSLIIR